MASRGIGRLALAVCVGGFVLGFSGVAVSQSTSVSMVQQDQSDCSNADVRDNHGGAPGGTVWLVRNNDGSTGVQVAISATPLTSYNFFLKCVRALGVIKTDEDGIGGEVFSIPSGGVGQTFAFDMYPDGAPSGNKFQSVQVTLK